MWCHSVLDYLYILELIVTIFRVKAREQASNENSACLTSNLIWERDKALLQNVDFEDTIQQSYCCENVEEMSSFTKTNHFKL
jgi:hypothetical protein